MKNVFFLLLLLTTRVLAGTATVTVDSASHVLLFPSDLGSANGFLTSSYLGTWIGSTNITTLGTITAGTVPWARVGSAPTTIAGYGITDAAPKAATYITQTASSGLSAEQALGSLATGLLKNTTTTGVLSTATAGTDYLLPNGSGAALTGLLWSQIGSRPTSLSGYGITDAQPLNTTLTYVAGNPGSSGQVLTSNGAGVAPTYQDATGGGGFDPASPGPIGETTPGSGKFSSLNLTGHIYKDGLLSMELQEGRAYAPYVFRTDYSMLGIDQFGNGVNLANTASLGWSNDANAYGNGGPKLWRDDTDILAQRRGVNAQAYRIYNTYTDADNYERIAIGADGASYFITVENAGTGIGKPLNLNATQYTFSGGDVWAGASDSFIVQPGEGIKFVEGENQRTGNATLVGGTVTVPNTSVTTSTVVQLTRKTLGGTVGNISYTITASSGFTINSSSPIETSTISYTLFEVLSEP